MSGLLKTRKLIVAAAASLVLILPTAFAAGVVQDTDVDGLTDESERTTYRTDPVVYDTDGDGTGDGEEVVDGTDPLDPKSSRFLELEESTDPGILGERDKIAWYFARATGIVAFIFLSFATVFGLVVSSRAFIGRFNLGDMLEYHRTVSWLALLSVIAHAASFFFEEFLSLSAAEIFVPFVLVREIRTALGFDLGLAVALGIIAFYLVIMLVLTAEFRKNLTAKYWRGLHYFSFLAYPLFVVHGFMAGTDSQEWWMKAIYIVSVTLVVGMIVVRIVYRNILPKIKARRMQSGTDPSIHGGASKSGD